MADIKHNLIINTSQERVFDAIASEKGLQNWWTAETDAKAEEGYINHFRFGSDYFNKMRITKLTTPMSICWECVDGPEEWIGTKLTFELEEKEDSTFLRFSHDGWAEATDFYGSCNYHWGYYLQSLKLLCETGKGHPFKAE